MAKEKGGEFARRGGGPVSRLPEPVLVGGSKEARRQAQAQRPAYFSRDEIRRIAEKLGGGITTTDLQGEPHVTLSAQVPWVEDRGYLNLINPQSVFADDPNAGFVTPFDGNVEGKLEVWLRGLEAGASYVLQIRVGSYSLDPDEPGLWEVRSSEGSPVYHASTGPDQTIPVFLLEVDGPLALVTLTSTGLGGWVFYDVQVHRLG
jgi:hypothetical protein